MDLRFDDKLRNDLACSIYNADKPFIAEKLSISEDELQRYLDGEQNLSTYEILRLVNIVTLVDNFILG